MTLTAKQELGLRTAVARYKAHEAYTCVSGYAGSGKSTLIKFIIAALGVPQEKVCYVAYTGKAAQVLKQKGCPNPITAHKLLYSAKPMPNGTYLFEAKKRLEDPYEIIVVDEVSMLPREMWLLLLSHRVHVIATGDPGQLPPVDKNSDNHVLDKPHVFLDEIMRQAHDSEIIRFSMWIREGKPIEQFPASNQQVMILRTDDVTEGMYEWADQILCAKNETRHEINKNMRQLKGFSTGPQVGDKIISLRNHWDFFSHSPTNPSPLTNGTIGTIQALSQQNYHVPYWISEKPIPVLHTNMVDEDNYLFEYIPIDFTSLTEGRKFLDGKQEFQMKKSNKCPDPPFEFAYAYCITTHKAQGSEWGKVLVFQEDYPRDRVERTKWAYTAATRASEKLVWVRS